MRKYFVGGIIVVLLGGYALWASTRSNTPAPVGGTIVDNGIGDSSSPSDVQPTGALKDGTYTGAVGSAAPYGQVQVKATISGGRLTKVEVLEKPQGPGYTNDLSAQVFPSLVKEAISIQSAKVHIYTGATQDTEGFQQSLGSALAQATN